MTTEGHLDGNALGALFNDLFGREMTGSHGCCDACGTVDALGSAIVYRSAGDVVCCSACGTVLIVAVSSPSRVRLNFESLRWLEID